MLITAADVLVLLAIQRLGVRKMEAFIILLISTIGVCFVIEIFLCKPSIGGIVSGFLPRPLSGAELYVAIGILGATVMPHNLYLHSALLQSRDVTKSRQAVAEACRYNLVDSAIAMNAAFLVNAAILIVAAATFYQHGKVVTEIPQAAGLLENLLGSKIAPIAFALARLHEAELVLMHVVDGVGGQCYGEQTGDEESREDETYLQSLAERLRSDLQGQGVPAVDAILGYGDPSREIVKLAREQGIDFVVMGGHGHRGLLDWLYGQTITGVRHGLTIPVLTVRK